MSHHILKVFCAHRMRDLFVIAKYLVLLAALFSLRRPLVCVTPPDMLVRFAFR